MPEPKKRSSASTSPFKLALAAALAVTFVVVLVVQFGGASGTARTGKQRETGENKVRAPRRTVAPNDGPRSQAPRRRRHTASRWPALQTADMLEHDPFAVPAAFLGRQDSTARGSGPGAPDAARGQRARLTQRQAELDRVLDSLKQEGVKVVIGSSKNGPVAVVGSQVVHVGDVLEGFRVVAIERDGVVLERPAME